MFAEQLNEQMRRFINEMKQNRQRKQAAAARGRAIDCMELEDRILLSASPIAPESLVNKTAAGAQQIAPQTPKAVAADSTGTHAVAVWSSQNADGSWSVVAQRLNSAGGTVGDPISVSSHTSADQQHATVSMNPTDGTFVITWSNDNPATDSTPGSTDVYARQFNANGTPKDDVEHLVTTQDINDHVSPSVAMNSSGGFVVTWACHNQDGTGWNIYAAQYDASGNPVQRLDSSGNPLGADFQVGASDSTDQPCPRVATDGTGNFTVIWQSQDGDGLGIVGQQFDASGKALRAIQVNPDPAGNQQDADIAMNATGSFVVSWTTDDQGVYAQRFNADGSTVNGQFQVNTTSADQSYGAIYTVSGCGSDIWATSDQFQYASTQVSNDVTMIAKVTSVSDTGTFAKAGVMFRDNLDPDSMHAMIYCNPQNLVVFQWRTNNGDWCTDTYSSGDIQPAYVKLTRIGNDFSGYCSTDGVNWVQVGQTQTIAMNTTYYAGLEVSSWNANALCTAEFHNVTINGRTDFVLNSQDIGSPAIAGSCSRTDGFQVASPTVAIDDSGEFLITWSSCNQDSPGSWGVYSQLYAANGNAVGPETRVNSTTEGSQANSSAAFLGPARYVVVWTGQGSGDDSGVFASMCDVGLLGQDVNSAPVNNVPGDQTVNFNTPVTFSAANGNAIQITDPNIDPNNSSVDVPNGSFESPFVSSSGYEYAPNEGDWNFSHSDDGNIAESGIVQSWAWGNPYSPDGQQVAFIQGAGSIWQNITFNESGNYTISFQGAHRDYYVGSGPTNPIAVQVVNTTTGEVQMVGTIEPDSLDFKGYRTDSFAVTAGTTYRVSFTGTSPDTEDRTTYLDAISIVKTDSIVSVSLSVDHGTLSLPHAKIDSSVVIAKGLIISQGTGTNDTAITLSGSLADVNAALDGLYYVPEANFVGTAHLTITTNDMDSNAVGGVKSTTSTVAINEITPSQTTGLLATYYNCNDLALGKYATESSVYSDGDGTYYASDAVDGDLTNYSHTNSVQGECQWWQVDLSPGTNTELTQIVVYNRNGCGDRLSNFTISVIANDGTTVWSQVYTQPTTDGQRIVFDTGTINGEYVKIQKNDSNFLHLAEVQVFDYTPVSRVDPTVNFNWGVQNSPAPGIPGANWVATWQGTLTVGNGDDYTFYATADDGVRLWVNDQLVCDGWQPEGATQYSGTIHLDPGQYSIRMDYFQGGWSESVKLEWSTASMPREVIPAGNLSCANLIQQQDLAKTNTVPGDQSDGLNQPLVFSVANGNAIQVSDPNASADSSLEFSSGFEFPDVGWGNYSLSGYQGGWTFSDWNNDNGYNSSAVIVANGSGYNNPDAPVGGQAAAIEGNGTMWQDVTFAEAGNYSISLLAAYRDAYWCNGTNPISVAIDGVEVGVITPTTTDHYEAFQTDDFTVTAGVHRLSFTGLDPNHGYVTSFIDQVSITRNAPAIQVNLSVANGTLTLARTDGLKFISGDGANDSSMTFVGSVDDINAALDGLQFLPGTVDFVGTANLQITTTTLGSILTGGSQSTTNNVAINVSTPSDYTGLLATYYNYTGTDLALGKNASESTDPFGWSASNAVDGDLTTCNHTDSIDGQCQWLQVDLSPGTDTRLTQIVLYNRDGCGDRLSHFTVSVIASDGLTTVWSQTYDQPTTDGEVLTFNTGVVYGEYVKIQKNDSNFLHLDEVKVFDSSSLPTASRIDPSINFDWSNGDSPAPGLPGTAWSASWQGELQAESSGNVLFRVTADSSAQLYINGQAICDTLSGTLIGSADLSKDVPASFEFDYIRGDQAQAKVEWSYDGGETWEVIPATQFSCANLIQNTDDKPGVTVPPSQNVSLNTPIVFSSAHQTAITVSDSDAASASTVSVPISDNSFEDPNIGWGGVTGGGNGGGNQGGWYYTYWDGWVNESAVAANGSPYGNPDAPDGSQVAAIEGNRTVWQDVNFAEAGKYTVNFMAAYIGNNPGWGWISGSNPIAVQIDGVTVGTITPASNDHFDAYQTDSFVVAAGVHRLTFVGLTTDGSDRASFIDNVSITRVAPVVQVTLAIDNDNGTLTLANTNKLVFLSGDGVNDSSMTFLGAVDDVNAALDGMQFMPKADFANTATLTITTSDLMSLVNGGPKTDTQTVAIKVSVPTQSTGLLCTYYNNTDLLGPGIQRIDPSIDFDWGNQGSPAPGIGGYNWSATWQGQITATVTGEYTFYVTADDGFRFWVNDASILDQWVWYRDVNTPVPVTTYLQAGQSYAIRLDFFQAYGYENVKLEWSAADDGQAREIVPTSQLSHTNVPPAVTVPGQQTTDEATDVVFSQENGNAIQVSDPDTINGTLQVTLAVNDGTLTLSRTNGLTFVGDDHNGAASMTFTGSQSDINAALENLHYTPGISQTGQYLHDDELTITATDVASQLTGGPKTTPETVFISITPARTYNDLLGTYYANNDFTGTTVSRLDSTTTMQAISGTVGSARWLGSITVDQAGTYTFYTTVDNGGGARLWINDDLLIDAMDNTGTNSFSGTVYLAAGTYSFRMDYEHGSGTPGVKLEWSTAGQTRALISSDHFEIADQTPVNAIPDEQFGILNQSIVFSEQAGSAISVGELHYQDGDLVTVSLTATAVDAPSGTLTVDSEYASLITAGENGTSSMTLTGTLAQINAALDGLTYARPDGYAGEASITIVSTNPSAEGGPRSTTDTILIGAVQSSYHGLVATYYSDTWLGTPVVSRIDSNIYYDWGNEGKPATGVGPDNWSACWEGLIEAPTTGAYTFSTTTDDGCRLWVDDQLLIDNWGPQALATKTSAAINLVAGHQYSIRMEYCQFGAGDSAKLAWSTPDQPDKVVQVPDGQIFHQPQVPVYYLPGAQSINQDSPPLHFRTADGNAIVISDVDAQSNLLSVTLTPTNGTIAFGSTAGLVNFSVGSDATVTFEGQLAAVNAALNTMTFTPAANFSGIANLRIVTTDTRTSKTADGSVSITVVAVNHPPIAVLPASPTIFDFDPLTFSGANAITIADPDISPTDTSSVTVVNGDFEAMQGRDNATGWSSDQYHGPDPGWSLMPLYWTNGETVPNSSGLAGNGAGIGNPNSTGAGTTQVAYLQGGGAISQTINFAEAGTYTISFEAAYRDYGGRHPFMILVDGASIGTFNPNSEEFRGYSATFSVSKGDHVITFQGQNELTDKTAFIDHISIAKTSSLVQVSLSVDHGTLNLGSDDGVTFTSGDGVNDMAMTFTGSLADVNAAISSLVFTAPAHYNGQVNLRITTNDLGNSGIGGPKSTSTTLVINVQAYDQAPTVDAPKMTQGTYGGQPIVFSSAGANAVTVGDPDAGNNPVQVTLSVSHGVLALGSATSGLTVVESTDNAGVFTMTIEGTIANINAALNGLSYTYTVTPTSKYPVDDTLSIHIDDLGHCGVGGPLTSDRNVSISVLGGPVVNQTLEGDQTTSWQTPQAVASDANGNYVVVWSAQNPDGDGWDIYARRFTAAGTAQGDEFRVNNVTAGDQMYATVAMNAGGSFVVTWTDLNGDDGADVYARLYDAAGKDQGGQFRINATTAGDQMYTSVAMDSNGGFVAVWSTVDKDGNGLGVYARQFSNLGQTAGPEITVATGDAMFARVAMDDAGNFTVVWQGRSADTGLDIYGQRFDAWGNPVGSPQFLVNDTTTAGNQYDPSIAMNGSGAFVVTWTSDGQDGAGRGIFGQRYDANGSPEKIYTISGGGSDIWGTSDQLQYDYTQVSNDVTMIAQVSSMSDTGYWAKAGVMFRDDLNPDSMHAMVYVNPENLVVFQWRTSDGAWTADTYSAGAVGSPVYVKLTRVNDDFSGYYSTDGVTWTQVGATQTIAMSTTFYAGLEVCANNTNALCTAEFHNVSINGNKDIALTSYDIGSPYQAGSSVCTGEFQVAGGNDGVYTVSGEGNDIGGTSDQGNFAYEEVDSDNVTMIAYVDSMTDTAYNAKAGLMFRNTTDADSTYAYVFATPGEGIGFQWRNTTTEWFSGAPFANAGAPVWIKLTREGSVFSGYYSWDGVDWTLIGTTDTIVMGSTTQAGLAVSSLTPTTPALCTAKFSNVTINGSTNFTLTDTDLGLPAFAGSCLRGDFNVNFADAGNRDYSSVAMDEQGDFMVAWSSYGQDTQGAWGVHGQRYNADGTTEGPETRVNITTDGSQVASSITALSPDNYMVVWSGSAPGEDAGVFYSEQSPVGLVASFFNNTGWIGPAVAEQVAPQINYDWGNAGSPAAGVLGTYWSGTWAGMIKAETSETYTFYASGDDGFQVYINGIAILPNTALDNHSPANTYTGTVTMLAGQWYQIVVQYNQINWGDCLKLEWSSPSIAREVIPCTQFAHANQAPVNTTPASANTLKNTDITFADRVSVPVDDGSFESPNMGDSNVGSGFYTMGGSAGAWTFVNSSGIMANGSAYNNPTALDGSQAAFIQGTGTMSQDVYFAQAGEYTISFLAAYRDYYNGSNPVDILVDGNKIGTITPGSVDYRLYQTDSFSVEAGTTHTITFVGTTTGGPDRTSFIDDVSISSVNQNAIRIGDPDASSTDPVTVTLSVDHGTLSLNDDADSGLETLNGDGTNVVSFKGTLDSVNAALNGLVFKPTAGFQGQAVLQIISSDTGGKDGRQTTISTMTINVVGPPVNTVPDPQSVTEHQTLVFSNAAGNAISVGDPNVGNRLIQVTLTATHGTMTLSNVGNESGLTFLPGQDGINDSTITMTGTVASINDALDGLQFKPQDNYGGPALLTIETDDLANSGMSTSLTTISTVSIGVTSVNDPPVNVLPPTQDAYTQYPLTLSGANAVRITDPDITDPNASDTPIQVTLSVDNGTISLGNVNNGLTVLAYTGVSAGTKDTQIQLQGTLAQINAALDGMTFKADDGFEGTAHLDILTNDLGNAAYDATGRRISAPALTASSSLTINVARANEPPAITAPDTTFDIVEHQDVRFSSLGNAIRVSDPDAGNSAVMVTLSTDHGTITLSGNRGGLTILSGSASNSTGVTLIGTLSDINAALDGMEFSPNGNYDGAAALHINVNDLGNSGAGGPKSDSKDVTFHVTSINDPPTVDARGTLKMFEHDTVVFSSANGNPIGIWDIDTGDNPIQVTLTADYGTFALAGVKGLTFASGSGPNGTTMTFRGTLADVNAALDGLKYTSPSTISDLTANLKIIVNDLGFSGTLGGVNIVTHPITVNITAINDPPVISLPHLLGYDPTQIVFSAARGNPISISDPDAGNNPVMATIMTSDSTFTLATTDGLKILAGAPAQSTFITVYGTLTDINRAIDGLLLKASSSYAAMQISVDDLGINQGIGGPNTTTQTLYVRRTIDPNFQPGDSSARFQTRSGVMTQPTATTVATSLLRDAQGRVQMLQVDRDQINASLFASNLLQSAGVQRPDAGAADRASGRLLNRGDMRHAADMTDVKDARLFGEGQFSADTQNMNEPIQQGSALWRDESLLVGLGVVSAGYLAWAFNGGSFLAGALSATPMWMPFDPLAVLDFSDRVSKSTIPLLDGEEGFAVDDNLQALLG